MRIMEEKELRQLLKAVRAGTENVDDALLKLRVKPMEDLGYAKVDLQRGVRTGTAEVIFGQGKTPDQIGGIARTMLKNGQKTILITRLDAEKSELVERQLGTSSYTYSKEGRIAVVGDIPKADGIGKVLVITAGTSDIPVAEEAAVTSEALGNETVRVYDAGVAGLHRLLSHIGDICEATVIIAIAGMEGALPAVVTGLADCPVIAVPTSVGYGTAFGGMSALLSMLNCCASGMCVENIDNGFGAAFFASMINHLKGYQGSKDAGKQRDLTHENTVS